MHGWTLCGNRPANIYLSVKWVEVLESSQRISLSLPLLPCESWMFVKESPDEKKGKEKCMFGLALRNIMYISCLIYFIRWWNIVEKIIIDWFLYLLKKQQNFLYHHLCYWDSKHNSYYLYFLGNSSYNTGYYRGSIALSLFQFQMKARVICLITYYTSVIKVRYDKW